MGPLNGFKIVEIAGIGPGQFCGMLLADMGAHVIRIDRPVADDGGNGIPAEYNLMNRSRPTIAVDLKSGQGVGLVLRLCEDADAIFEGFRPGVMERLGLGPKQCMAVNERLVYGRMTGYGQEGPLADSAGHDSNYTALAGALHAIGDADRPPPIPLNLIGDFGGGGAYLAIGILAALLEAGKSGKGQIVDAAMVDGVASMLTMFYGLMAGGLWQDARHANLLDGGAPYVKTYETQDGRFVAVCAIENRFYRELLEKLEITSIDPADQNNRESWPEHEAEIAAAFESRTRDEWADHFVGSDACVAPVLSMREAPGHAQLKSRGVFVTVDGVEQPAPAPRFSRSVSEISTPPIPPGAHDRQALTDWGLSEAEIGRYL